MRKRRGPAPQVTDSRDRVIAEQAREITRWKHRAERAEALVEVQKKKYRPAFPERFGSIQDVRAHCHVFFPWYNTGHHHSSLGLLTPADVHHGLAAERVAARATVLATAYAAHPERFPGGLPQPPAPPVEVWISRPRTRALEGVQHTNARQPADP